MMAMHKFDAAATRGEGRFFVIPDLIWNLVNSAPSQELGFRLKAGMTPFCSDIY